MESSVVDNLNSASTLKKWGADVYWAKVALAAITSPLSHRSLFHDGEFHYRALL
jgi:hypothetical protein